MERRQKILQGLADFASGRQWEGREGAEEEKRSPRSLPLLSFASFRKDHDPVILGSSGRNVARFFLPTAKFKNQALMRSVMPPALIGF